jgi:predicted transcriptional regulator
MATTSLKLSEELKERVAKLAEASGKSAHAFMVDAIDKEARRSEQYQDFLAEAESSWQVYQQDGMAYDADEANAYFRAKIQGIELPKPQLRKYK